MVHLQEAVISQSAVRDRNRALDLLKWIAIVTMVIDHASILFPQYNLLLRTIGRCAFPIFCIMLAFNLNQAIPKKKTHTLKNYFKNLALFCVLSEVPYQLFNQEPFTTLNVMPTLLLGFLLVVLGESKHKYATLQFVSLLVVTTLLSNFIMYSVWGVLLIVFLYLFFKTTNVHSKKYFLMISVLLTSLANIFNWLIGGYYTDMTTYSSAFSFAVSSAIATCIGAQFLLKGQHMNLPFELPPVGKWAYWFYPVHLVIIWILFKFA